MRALQEAGSGVRQGSEGLENGRFIPRKGVMKGLNKCVGVQNFLRLARENYTCITVTFTTHRLPQLHLQLQLQPQLQLQLPGTAVTATRTAAATTTRTTTTTT